MRTPEELTDAFHDRGLKVTPQRQLLFRLLHDHDGHPTAEALYEVASDRMPGISLRTVYQTLNDLTELGELQQLSFGGAARFDPNTSRHHHARCDRCGALRDVYVQSIDRLEVEGLSDFRVADATIVFSGHCGNCATGDSHPSITQPPTSVQGAS